MDDFEMARAVTTISSGDLHIEIIELTRTVVPLKGVPSNVLLRRRHRSTL